MDQREKIPSLLSSSFWKQLILIAQDGSGSEVARALRSTVSLLPSPHPCRTSPSHSPFTG